VLRDWAELNHADGFIPTNWFLATMASVSILERQAARLALAVSPVCIDSIMY
jgi:hypothetical protein